VLPFRLMEDGEEQLRIDGISDDAMGTQPKIQTKKQKSGFI